MTFPSSNEPLTRGPTAEAPLLHPSSSAECEAILGWCPHGGAARVAKACLLNRVASQMGITPRVLLCRLSDLVGADIGLHVGANFHQSFPDRVYQARIIQLMNEHKRLGEKTGSGFYKFDKK